MNIIDVLRDRGFIEKTTHEQELYDYVENSITCYIGFDPTASSLHIGSLVPIMSLAHMQRMGHRPIALVGGGTGLVGDPSGKTEMRKMLTPETIEANVLGLKRQLSRFIDFGEDKALMLNNADWLTKLEYIPLLRDIGRHFSVNRMIKAESYKMRLDSEEGLSFIEFNYMILQAYDFMELSAKYGCRLQMGGSDQWGNIVAGLELIRKTQKKPAFGITFPLITTSNGAKMGKTAKGAVWLDSDLTPPYDYYQYWINTDDRDVERFMALFTFLPMEEVRGIQQLEGAELNTAKMVLAFEATALAHGLQEALKAYKASANVFGVRKMPKSLFPSSKIPRGHSNAEDASVPCTFVDKAQMDDGIPAYQLFFTANLAKSKGEARRLISQGGGYLNGDRIETYDYMVTSEHFQGGEILIRAGKKRFHKIKFQHQ
jgi:tyrosyl-tRNA synthetase